MSILLVLGIHAGVANMSGGFYGVDVFFVISGFLISALLLFEWEKSGSINLRSFYLRRAARLGPALLLVVLFVALCPGQPANVWHGIVAALFYVANIAAARDLSGMLPLMQTWSLATEEQFYLLWPVALVLLLRRKVTWQHLVAVLVLCLAGEVAWRNLILSADWTRTYYAPDTHSDGLLVGCICGILYRHWQESKINLGGCIGFVSLVLLAHFGAAAAPDTYRFWLLAVAISAGLLILSVALTEPSWALVVLESWPLAYLGRISYGVYLVHWPLYEATGVGSGSVSMRVAVTCLAICAAALSYHLVESPVRHLVRSRMSEPRAQSPRIRVGAAFSPSVSAGNVESII